MANQGNALRPPCRSIRVTEETVHEEKRHVDGRTDLWQPKRTRALAWSMVDERYVDGAHAPGHEDQCHALATASDLRMCPER